MGKRQTYSAEFRQKLVELVRAGGDPAKLAKEFGPHVTTVRAWVAQADRDSGVRNDGLTTDERGELRRLRREIKQLKEEREILAKATAWFARETETIASKRSS